MIPQGYEMFGLPELREIYKTGSGLLQGLFSVVRSSQQKPRCFRDPLAFILLGKGDKVFAKVTQLSDQRAA